MVMETTRRHFEILNNGTYVGVGPEGTASATPAEEGTSSARRGAGINFQEVRVGASAGPVREAVGGAGAGAGAGAR